MLKYLAIAALFLTPLSLFAGEKCHRPHGRGRGGHRGGCHGGGIVVVPGGNVRGHYVWMWVYEAQNDGTNQWVWRKVWVED